MDQFKQALVTFGLRTRCRGDHRDRSGRDFWWRRRIEFSELVSPEVAREVVGELLEPRVVRAPFLGLIKGEVEPLELDVVETGSFLPWPRGARVVAPQRPGESSRLVHVEWSAH